MLDTATSLLRYKLSSRDGDVGPVSEFYFDDRHWVIRYLVADTGHWMAGRQVLISPYALETVSRERHRIVLGLTRRQIEDGPSLRLNESVSPQFEEAYYGFHGWPQYWRGPYSWGCSPHVERDRKRWHAATAEEQSWERHLRNTGEVRGCYIQATDGELGHVDDFVIDEDTWAIRYLIINAQSWCPGKRVLMSPQWIQRVSWGASEMFVDLPRVAIKQSPEYSDRLLLSRDYEDRLHHHYDRRGYWADESAVTDYRQ